MRRALVFKNRSIQCISIAPPKIRSDSDILVRVHAAGINPLDRAMSRGYGAVLLDRLRGSDFVLGQEFSGICTFVGKNVMDVRVGDPVFGAVDPWSQCGTLTDELCVNEADVAKKPANVEHVRAASIPFAVMTVWRPVVQHAVKQRARSALVWGGRGSVGSVCAALLRDLVPGMQNVVVVGREGLESDEQFDVVVDAASTQGFPSDLSRFVKAQGLYCSFNGPWLMMAGEQGLLKGSISAGQVLLEKKVQEWTRNGSTYKWGVMRGGGNTALNQVARALECGQLRLPETNLEVLSLEQAAERWNEEPGSKKQIVLFANEKTT